MGFHPSHISSVFKEPILSEEIKAAAAKLFKVDVSVFDTGIEGLTDQPPPPPEKIDWQAEALATLRKLEELQAKYIRLLEELRNGRK